MKFSIYRYHPETDARSYMQDFDVTLPPTAKMLLDALVHIKSEYDDSLSLRRSCREGVCGSDGVNVNGKNGLACIMPLAKLKEPICVRPLPGLPVFRDLVVDLSQFYAQYRSVKPYLTNDTPPPDKERLQSPEDREELNGLYECVFVRLLLDGLSLLLVESGQICRSGRTVASLPLHRRHPRHDNQ